MSASKSLTPAERSLRAKAAAHARWANTDRDEASKAATRRSIELSERAVDPDGKLPAAELAVRAENWRKAHFYSLALKSAVARKQRRAAEAKADDAGPTEKAG